ncbi:hypothetical protein BGX24_011285 [Mortierella sp. AD032]|nr:hypothetical protein BGX24_011285 [Mortierella sp. AD032]
MCHLDPEFIDITWGAGGSRPAATLEVVSNAQKCLGVETCMHLICTDNSIETIDKALKEARACGNQNILALRGDPPAGQKHWSAHPEGLSSATSLVRHIRATHGDYFGIGVAAYPELHPESPTLAQDLYYLKQKIDAGADFIVTQLFFDVQKFLDWVKEVRKVGIVCPIVPGLMPIQTYAGFKKNVVDAGLSVPRWILEGLEKASKEGDQAVKAFGVEVGIQMTKELMESGVVPGVHFYTFNLEKSTRLILEGAGLVPSASSASYASFSQQQSQPQHLQQEQEQRPFISNSVASTSITLPALAPAPAPAPIPQTVSTIRKEKPWRSNFLPHRRNHEHQRPIFWANRPKSYISRTETWQTFPVNGSQWHSRSFKSEMRKYGSLEKYGVSLKYSTATEVRSHWNGQPRELKDLSDTFQKYWCGGVQSLPWCDHPRSLGGSEDYRERLVELNGVGNYLVINSQPVVNGARSDDKIFGWGAPGGYIYQKAFIEFFISPDQLPILINRLKTHFPNYTYSATNRSGTTFLHSSSLRSNKTSKSKSKSKSKRPPSPTNTNNDNGSKDDDDEELPNTVTWGVFPGQEIVQPTIVERSSFLAWKDEAFALWEQWARCFGEKSNEEDEGEEESVKTRKLLGEEIGQTWFLMNVVNNDYHESQGVFDLFEEDFILARSRIEAKAEDEAKVELGERVEVAAPEKEKHTEKNPQVDVKHILVVARVEGDGTDVFSSAAAAAALVAAAVAAAYGGGDGGGVCQTLTVDTVPVAAEAYSSA